MHYNATYMSACIHTYIHTCIHACVYMNAYKHTCVRTYIYTRIKAHCVMASCIAWFLALPHAFFGFERPTENPSIAQALQAEHAARRDAFTRGVGGAEELPRVKGQLLSSIWLPTVLNILKDPSLRLEDTGLPALELTMPKASYRGRCGVGV